MNLYIFKPRTHRYDFLFIQLQTPVIKQSEYLNREVYTMHTCIMQFDLTI